MGKESRFRFIFRTILLIIFIILFIIGKDKIISILNYEIIYSIKIYHLIWLYLMLETVILIIPYTNNHSYNGKLFLKHYRPVDNYDEKKLQKYIKKNNKHARSVFVAWIVLNVVLFIIYYNYNLSTPYIFLIFMIYYWTDMFCVNVWCPFHKLFFKSKCCNECRIYNWDHVMFCTPLLLIKSFWSYSLFLLSFFAFIQWEYMIKKHPERFSPSTNKKLQCKDCDYNCRFNKMKYLRSKNYISKKEV
ncbi:hypothetical protein [Terrisporobacter mayombei]|uniref:Uncharacterized protein n=1 Tax=Terrisporobacter mayombei TaxID=1541 RepID=A0ABY9PY37_9FIRM|nr:hypothetical protein [Terrisporobacter mayombei]MCC3868434.1 hypothetical protein [Terrisporobacter mayombei]WMT80583.1 hypothetical protein TEMA_09040 [Terrisporobacter mayombei]